MRYHLDAIVFYLEQIPSIFGEKLIHHLVTPYSSWGNINTIPRQDVGILPHHEGLEPRLFHMSLSVVPPAFYSGVTIALLSLGRCF
jgi:hypothetical protein